MSASTFLFTFFSALLLILSTISFVDAHGCLLFPNQRGALSSKAQFSKHVVPDSEETEIDFFMHFPAGDKRDFPGAGKNSQINAAGSKGWVLYDPFDANFKFRAGVCGDKVDGGDHLKGGQYYNGGMISATFEEEGILDAQIGISAHHNGFIELYVCNLDKCSTPDISTTCFKEGHCRQLMRAGSDPCETGSNKACGPVDPNYPGRWYLPCRENGKTEKYNWVSYGEGTIRYQLPDNFHCEHCALQWYWTSANNCNPPGLVDYFESSKHGPNWGKCRGQASAIGGYSEIQQECGRSRFPEEYYQCSDIRITAKDTVDNEDQDQSKDDTMSIPKPIAVPTGEDDENQNEKEDDDENENEDDDENENEDDDENEKEDDDENENEDDDENENEDEDEDENQNENEDEDEDENQNENEDEDEDDIESFKTGFGAVRGLALVRNGRREKKLRGYSHIHNDIITVGSDQLAIEAFSAPEVEELTFKLYDVLGNLKFQKTNQGPPFYMFGSKSGIPNPWTDIPMNEKLKIVVTGKGDGRSDRDNAFVMFI